MGNITETSVFESLQEHYDDVTATDVAEWQEQEAKEELMRDENISHENVERAIYVISKLERQIDELKMRQDASKEFYDNEIEKVGNSLAYQTNALRSFLEGQGKKTMKFPNGTLSVRKSTKHMMGDEEKLMAWCEEMDKDGTIGLIKETRKPSKSAITKFIKSTGFSPDEWEIIESKTFNVKTNVKRR